MRPFCLERTPVEQITSSEERGFPGCPVGRWAAACKEARDSRWVRVPTCAEIPVKDFIGSLKGKKLQDLVQAIEAGKVTVVVSTKQFLNGEICGMVEDP